MPKKQKKDIETTTIQIYKKDYKKIIDSCKKNENLRDKLHEIIKGWKR